jgi:hypothetical protein
MMPNVSIVDPNMPLVDLCRPEIVEAVTRYWSRPRQALSKRDHELIREYLYQWIQWCSELGAAHQRENRKPALEKLRFNIDFLNTRDAIDDWVWAARDAELYPL